MEHAALGSLPMSYTERMLKECFGRRPDLQKHILTNEELTEYIAWLINTYSQVADPSAAELRKLTLRDTAFSALAGKIAADPRDRQARENLSALYQNHREVQYLTAGSDIYIGRMIRYMPAHWHTNDFFEIYYCASGSCPIHFPEERILMKPGTVLIVAPSVVHASPCYADDALLYYYIVRSSTFDEVFWRQLPGDSLMSSFFRQALSHASRTSYLQFETEVDPKIEEILAELNGEFAAPGIYSAQLLNVLMSEFFLRLLRRYEGTARLPRTEDFYWKHEFSAIFSFIQTHYLDMTLAEIARHFGYSERQISRIAMNCTGENYAQLVLRLRMERAAALLRRQELSIDAIAGLSGYTTNSSFYRAFTAWYGCTPAKYRKERYRKQW